MNLFLKKYTHVVSALQGSVHVHIHVMMIERHEQRVYDNTKGDEQFDKWVKNK